MTGAAITAIYIWDDDYQNHIQTQIQTQIQTKNTNIH